MSTPRMSEDMCLVRTRQSNRILFGWLFAALLALPGAVWPQSTGNGAGNNPPPTGGAPLICATCEPGDPPPVLDASYVSQSVPTTMVAGQSYLVSLTFSNTGSQTWTETAAIRLGSQSPENNSTWGTGRLYLSGSIATGQYATFTYRVTAPVTAGTYNFQWRMLQEGVTWFGTTSPNVSISVSAANTAPSVQLTAPANNTSATAPTSLSLAANAADAGGAIVSVSFWSGSVLLGTDTSSPYAWTLASPAIGSYSFKAIATDNGGMSTTSSAVGFTVLAAPVSAVSATRIYVYDVNQRLCKTINPESGATVVDYDAAGNIAWIAEGTALTTAVCNRSSVANTQKLIRKYDALNRVKLVETPGGTADLATTYYLDGQVKSFAASNPGKNVVTTSYFYNKRRLITAESSSNGSTLFTLGYGYDANGFLASLTYPDNQSVNYVPDALGRATQVASAAGVTYASGITYAPGGAISGFTYGNGITHTMQANARMLPIRSLDSFYSGATQVKVLDDTYVFDPNANVSDIIDQAQNGLTTRGMAYDGRDRLTAAVSPLQWGNATYAYDALDNLKVADQGARQYRYNYDAANRLANIKSPAGLAIFTLGYDSRGNTTSKNSQLYGFDSVNRMSQVTGLQTYRYDGQGRRVQTTDSDGKTTFWIYSQSGQVLYTSEARRNQNLSYIYVGNSQIVTRAIAWGGGAATLRFQHTDALGSPVAETDSFRNIVKRNSYAPYGEAYGATVIDGTGYTGHVMDRGTGLTYMQQRYYDPQIGRFLSVDPVPSRESGDNFNRYTYANSNSYRFTDPDGRESGMFQQKPYRMTQPPPEAIAGVALVTTVGVVLAPAGSFVAGTIAGALADSAAGSVAGSIAVNGPAIVVSAVIVADGIAAVASNGGSPSPAYVAGGKFSSATKVIAAARASKACEYCGVPTTPAQKSMRGVSPPKTEGQTDHIVPRSQGGTNSPDNAAHACRECNRKLASTPKPNPREEENKE